MQNRDNLRGRLRHRASGRPATRQTIAESISKQQPPKQNTSPKQVASPKYSPSSKTREFSFKAFPFLWLLFILVFLALVGVTAMLGYKYFDTKDQLKQAKNQLNVGLSSTVSGDNQIEQLISTVSKAVDLPDNETPTYGIVDDLEILKDEPFFRDVQIGDKFLVYKKAAVALIYRPSTNKIIVYGPINATRQN